MTTTVDRMVDIPDEKGVHIKSAGLKGENMSTYIRVISVIKMGIPEIVPNQSAKARPPASMCKKV
ncbi:MAG: hypothetical protein LBP95_03220 [Deltaproteobacteria bacterium]|jgi:hypothetical protein|nr:hypothetical protein [Deltaproteobacteria bacterium]